MATILNQAINAFNYLNHDLSDPRSHQYYIILNPFIMFTFAFLFYKFIYDWGPKFMEKREPYKLENILIFYNASQILISAYIAFRSFYLAFWTGYYNFTCQPIIWDDTPIEREANSLVRLYYLVKIFDLLDTIFFILRKKNSQVSFLHVYHHLSMLVLGFCALKYVPAGHGAWLGIVNSAVHTVMYSYYLLTCINPDYKKSIWWKKYITQLQIAQFLFLLVHFTRVLFQPSCLYPKWISILVVPQNIFMLLMFSDFYNRTYIKKKDKQ
ncbi:very long chain fatty acid elongase AAEL008004-like [Arctopsyche grandis]|uniref:very long chain fatty acid elongase AAEL008004-like n=1 Tax=Arctopsyche grandis TaxID=121162 RepID=UPI00406D84E5